MILTVIVLFSQMSILIAHLGSRTIYAEDITSTSQYSNTTMSASKPTTISECQVLLDDIFSSDQAEKLKVLNFSLDKYHSASSRQSFEKNYLESLTKKDPIAWPPMKDSEKWSQLDDAVSCHLGGSTIHDRVALLETTIFSKASDLFGHLPPPKKGFRGLNRRAQHSIKLVIEKNNLLAQINSCIDESSKASLIQLLNLVRQRLRNFRRGEKSRKNRGKIKQAYQSF